MKQAYGRIVPKVVVFFGSLSIMVLELVASRIISKYFGSSLYTWTGVIGVILAGISVGNYLGGRLADQFSSSKVIVPVLLISSVLVFLILLLDNVLGHLMKQSSSIVTSIMILKSLSGIVFLFLIPSTFLGMISPIMAKFALEMNIRVGTTVGSIYALSAFGSIIGTFLAGFVLIPLLDVRIIILLVSILIAFLSFLFQGRRIHTLVVLFSLILLFFVFYKLDPERPGKNLDSKILYSRHSQYSHIQVKDYPGRGGSNTRVLVMDGLQHNLHDPSNPDNLIYEYERIFRAFTEQYLDKGLGEENFSILTLGGGAMTYPAYVERHWKTRENTVVEIDPRVVRIAYDYFDIPPTSALETIIADARNFVGSAREKRQYNLIFIDAFNSFSVPYHLTTREFTEDLSLLLKPEGAVIVNIIDIFSLGKFLGSYYSTLKTVFSHVGIYAKPNTAPDSRNTFVLAASNKPILPQILVQRDNSVLASLLPEDAVKDLVQRSGGVILTDHYAPVDSFIAPIFLKAIN